MVCCALFTALSGCGKLDDGAFLRNGSTSATDYSGYIIVANNATKSVILLSPTGGYVRDLFDLPKTASDVPVGLGMYDADNVMVAVDGVDRVVVVNIASGEASSLITDANLAGTIGNLARLVGGDILVAETNNVERFTSTGLRVTAGGWPRALQTTGSGLSPLSNGGFVHCSTGTDVIRAYDSTGTQTATAASGIGGTTDVRDCQVGPSGQVLAVFNGTTDTIRVYSSSTLAITSFSYSDTSILSDPRTASFRPNGNVLAVDFTNNLMVEISSTGSLVATYTVSAISGANRILVVP